MKADGSVLMRWAVGLTTVIAAGVLASSAAAISPNVVISQFQTRGTNGVNDEFVELYNRSTTAVDIGLWGLGETDGVNFFGLVQVPSGTILGSRCHYLFANNGPSGYDNGAVPADQTFGLGIPDLVGLAIYTSAPSTMDAVSTTSFAFYREGASLSPRAPTDFDDASWERRPGLGNGNGQDTDTNRNDFYYANPSKPRNQSSPCINHAPVIGSVSDKSVGAGNNLDFTVPATDADDDPLTYSATGTPAGSTFDPSTGEFSWTPTAADVGSRAVSMAVSDGHGGANATGIQITVNPDQPPVLDAIGNKATTEGEPLQFSVSGADSDADDTLTYSAFGLPSGAAFSPATRTFSWTPGFEQAGSYPNVHFAVSDGRGEVDSEDVTINVALPSNHFTAGEPKLNDDKGTATLSVTVSGPGTLTLTGKGLVAQSQTSAAKAASADAEVKLVVKAKGKAKEKLATKGKLKVRAKITFTPTGGAPASQTKTLTLKRK
jgi:Putative Ig domain/Lamin Tail Domain